MSEWISSEMTLTPWRTQMSPRAVSSADVQSLAALGAAHLAHGGKLLLTPAAAHGVVRVAEHERLDVGLRRKTLKLIEIHAESALIVPDKMIEHKATPVVTDGVEKRRVDWRLDDDAVAGSSDVPQGDDNRRHHAGTVFDVGRVDRPAVALLLPPRHASAKSLGAFGVAQYAAREPLFDDSHNRLRHSKIHVGYP